MRAWVLSYVERIKKKKKKKGNPFIPSRSNHESIMEEIDGLAPRESSLVAAAGICGVCEGDDVEVDAGSSLEVGDEEEEEEEEEEEKGSLKRRKNTGGELYKGNNKIRNDGEE